MNTVPLPHLRPGMRIVNDNTSSFNKPYVVKTVEPALMDSAHLIVNGQFRFHKSWEVIVG